MSYAYLARKSELIIGNFGRCFWQLLLFLVHIAHNHQKHRRFCICLQSHPIKSHLDSTYCRSFWYPSSKLLQTQSDILTAELSSLYVASFWILISKILRPSLSFLGWLTPTNIFCLRWLRIKWCIAWEIAELVSFLWDLMIAVPLKVC